MAALALLLWRGNVRHWPWTGFGEDDTLWDWLELVLLPTAVATLRCDRVIVRCSTRRAGS